YYNTDTMLNYEVRLYEGQTAFDVIYGTIVPIGAANDSALTVGVQKTTAAGDFTSVGCDPTGGQSPFVSSGQLYHYTLGSCGTPTPTATPTTSGTPSATPTATATSTPCGGTDVILDATFEAGNPWPAWTVQ